MKKMFGGKVPRGVAPLIIRKSSDNAKTITHGSSSDKMKAIRHGLSSENCLKSVLVVHSMPEFKWSSWTASTNIWIVLVLVP